MAPNALRAHQVVRELAPHSGFPPTQIFDSTSCGPRRSTRSRQAVKFSAETSAKASKSSDNTDSKLAPKKCSDQITKTPRKDSSTLNPRAPPKKGSKARAVQAALEVSESDEDDEADTESQTPSPETLPHSFKASPSPLDLLASAAATAATECPPHKVLCPVCADLTRCTHLLTKSACGNRSWWAGPMGCFEIGRLRWPHPKNSFTYQRREAARAMTFKEARRGSPAGSEGTGDTEVDEEANEEDLRFDEVKGLIREWKLFCRYGKRWDWGAWLDERRRPEHIDKRIWDEIERRRNEEIDKAWEEKMKQTKSWIEVAK